MSPTQRYIVGEKQNTQKKHKDVRQTKTQRLIKRQANTKSDTHS